ncbi:MAG TPA: hypothetical protein PKN54_00340 [Candidatus Cloacimonas acidaminovorans]|nr:hypothetical protein [Candidatus Cloacimonas acidaminovorans]
MISKSKEHNPNYLAKLVKIKEIKDHPNADRLKLTVINFADVIIGDDIKTGDMMVYFPLESQINVEFLKDSNQFSSELLNKDSTKKGYFDKNGRVRAVKLRGVGSNGILMPLKTVEDFFGKLDAEENEEFDTINDVLCCKKYQIPVKEGLGVKVGKKPKETRLIDGQVKLHVDTERLDKNLHQLNYEDYISITYKLHGTSWWCANVPVKRRLNIIEKLLRKIGIKINDVEYDHVYGSRKVVKNSYADKKCNDFYDGDLWSKIKNELADKIPKGFTLYGECVGYTDLMAYIQSNYDYGCDAFNKQKIFVYRITFTNNDGISYELSTEQIMDFCYRFGLNYVPVLYYGKISDYISNMEMSGDDSWRREFYEQLKKDFTEKDCFMCKNKVPEE